MFNPIDMLQAQGGAGMQTMAQQFGLSPEQTRRAMEALLPAFAIGLQRNTPADPTGLSQLFGSPMLTQAVLQQAAMTSGVGAQVLRQMLPAMAGAVVASIVHVVLNPPPPAEPAQQAQSAFPFSPAWVEMMKLFLPPAEAPQAAKPGAAGRSAPAGQARPKEQAADPQANAGREMLQQLLKTGAEVQEQNVKAMQGLFDAFWTEAGKESGRESRAPDRAAEASGAGQDAESSEGRGERKGRG
jgi:hypothetical protein